MTSAPARKATRPIRSLEDVDEPAVRAWVSKAIQHPAARGFLFCGSRVTGWAEPDGDYDGFLYVTEEHRRALSIEEVEVRLMAEGVTPKRLIGDFSLISDVVLQEHLRSPLDIDHWPYLDAVMVDDKTGDFEAWRKRIAAFPTEELRTRSIQKYIQLVIAYHYATMDDVRGYPADRQLNLYRAALAGAHLWFTLQRRWAPPFKWWTREVERLEIRPDSRAVLEGAILNPTIETVTHLRDHLKTEMKYAGITEIENITHAFFETLLPENRPSVYRNSYL